MKRPRKVFDDLMTAVTFAEPGELDTGREFLHERERVLVALAQGQVESRTLRYALNTCKRIGADLDILYASTAAGEPELGAFLKELEREGIGHRLVRRTGCLRNEVVDYVNSHPGIAFAVMDRGDEAGADCKDGLQSLADWWEKVKCPLVVVTGGA